MSFIRASGLGPLTASNTATIVDPATPLNGSATMGPLVSYAAVTASGTSVTFTGIPSWAKRITVMYNAISTSGTAAYLLQLGYGASPTYQATGYNGESYNGATASFSTNGAGAAVALGMTASSVWSGTSTITLLDASTNTWTFSGVVADSSSAVSIGIAMHGWSVALSGTLSAVKLTPSNGTDTFDAGKVGLMYE